MAQKDAPGPCFATVTKRQNAKLNTHQEPERTNWLAQGEGQDQGQGRDQEQGQGQGRGQGQGQGQEQAQDQAQEQLQRQAQFHLFALLCSLLASFVVGCGRVWIHHCSCHPGGSNGFRF